MDIHGGVEIWSEGQEDNDDAKQWWPVINVEVMLNQNYALFGSLFGVRNPTTFAPVAEGRFLPDDASERIRRETDDEGYLDHTWITWEELKAIDWDEVGWINENEQLTRHSVLGDLGQLLMELMASLARHYGDPNVRLVVWFNYFDHGFPKFAFGTKSEVELE